MKFGGLGINQIIVLWVILALITIMIKTVVNKYYVKGLTEVVNTL
jgi:uncharacterized membrane protein YedE/YeeE